MTRERYTLDKLAEREAWIIAQFREGYSPPKIARMAQAKYGRSLIHNRHVVKEIGEREGLFFRATVEDRISTLAFTLQRGATHDEVIETAVKLYGVSRTRARSFYLRKALILAGLKQPRRHLNDYDRELREKEARDMLAAGKSRNEVEDYLMQTWGIVHRTARRITAKIQGVGEGDPNRTIKRRKSRKEIAARIQIVAGSLKLGSNRVALIRSIIELWGVSRRTAVDYIERAERLLMES